MEPSHPRRHSADPVRPVLAAVGKAHRRVWVSRERRGEPTVLGESVDYRAGQDVGSPLVASHPEAHHAAQHIGGAEPKCDRNSGEPHVAERP